MERIIGGTDRYGREQKRQAILTAALGVFLEKGYEGATVDDVIKEGGRVEEDDLRLLRR